MALPIMDLKVLNDVIRSDRLISLTLSTTGGKWIIG